MKDKTGKQEIEVGSYIVYATTLGRSSALKFGKVIGINIPKEPEAYQKKGDCSYRVIGIDDNWFHMNKNMKPELNKPGTLLYGYRMVVIPFEFLPDYAQKLLGKISNA